MLKVILFDVDNTLLSFDESVKEAMKSGFEKFGIGTYREEMFSVFCRINDALWHKIETGELDFEGLLKTRWNRIFEQLGFSADGEAFETHFRECLFESAFPEKGAADVLAYLHGKYTLCVASNGPYHQQVNRLRIGGMLPYFSHLFISMEMGFSKPSRDFFTVCMDRLKKEDPTLLPEEVMVIGDSLSSDIAGGMRFGMKTCFYNPSETPVPREIAPDFTVKSLGEIQNIL